jgi:primosomal protein N' (replication factor Y) (superfamily II helicase)
MTVSAEIVVPVPLAQTYTYTIPQEMTSTLKPGCRVKIPFGTRRLIGCILSLQKDLPSGLDPGELKTIEEQLDPTPLLPEPLLRLMQWSADYYLAPIGEVWRTIVPPQVLKGQMKDPKPRNTQPSTHDFHRPAFVTLTKDQDQAYQTILQSLNPARKEVFLLHGITGSGKTEVYLHLMAETLKQDKQVIYLVPEIGLTPQLIGRMNALFPNDVAIYHSRLSVAERYAEWLKVKRGEVSIILGTRSALFAPFDKIGLIVVDEEHDGSYKQEERFRYHARDLAIMRSQFEDVPIILGSATPSLESFHNAQQKKYTYLSLPERAQGAIPPEVQLINMKLADATLISPKLIQALDKNLKAKHQSLIFLNRRGYSTLTLCAACGQTATCPDCSISLTLHKKKNVLMCHYCDFQQPIHSECPQCKLPLQNLGFGTEQVETELNKLFPQARIVRMDRDTVSKKGATQELLGQMKRKEIDILIGTQMVTKGHDYPDLTLVGILAADLALSLPDFRASERNFQILMQVAGRAGRAQHAGQVLLQTYQPDHYSIRWMQAHDYFQFFQEEIIFRKELGYPPFNRLVHLKIMGKEAGRVPQAALQVMRYLEKNCPKDLLSLLGPAPCP